MNRAKTSSRNPRHKSRLPLGRTSASARRRAIEFKLESLEARTMLSFDPTAFNPASALGLSSTDPLTVTPYLRSELERLGASRTDVVAMTSSQLLSSYQALRLDQGWSPLVSSITTTEPGDANGSGSAPESSTSAVSSPINRPLDVSVITWNGVAYYAKTGQWIASFDKVGGSPAEQRSAIDQRLAAAGIQASATKSLGQGTVLLHATGGQSYEQLVAGLNTISGFRYAEPNIWVANALTAVPNDPMFEQLYGLENTGQSIPGLGNGIPGDDISALEAWDLTTGSHDVVVADVDTGVDYTHPDLVDNMWHNPGEIPNNGIDDDDNGFVDDYFGYDFANNDGDPFDDNEHGTHTAGTVGAVGNNDLGVTGVNWTVQIMAVKWIAGNGSGSTEAAVAATNYVTLMRERGTNVRVSTNSWHVFGPSQALKDAIAGQGDAGILSVFAAGNDGQNRDVVPDYPSSYSPDLPNMITVAATDNRDQLASFSAYGLNTIDLAAPGVQTLSTTPGNTYSYLSGTSMATPHVAGVAALAWSLAPNATYQQVRDAILGGVDLIDSVRTDGPTPVATGGRLNAYKALLNMGPAVIDSDPAANSVVTAAPPTTFTLTFTQAIDPASVDAADFTVNGVPADDATLSDDGLLITYSYDTSPVTSEGPQTMHLPADSVVGLASGLPNASDFNAVFYYVQVQLQVTSTDPPVGSVLGSGTIALVVHFNKPLNPSSIDTSDFQVSQGTVTAADLVSPTSIELTIQDVNQDGAFILTIPSFALLDESDVGNVAFTGTYSVDVTTAAYPVPLGPKAPFGSLIYDPSIGGSIGFVGDEDTYTLPLAANQNLTLVLKVDPELIGELKVVGPTGTIIATATGSAAGETVVFQSAPVATSGTYSLVVSGAGGTTGGYTLQAILNAEYKQADDDISSIDTAWDLDGAFTPLDTTPTADRAGVVGRLGGTVGSTVGPNGFGYGGEVADPDFIDISGTGTPTLIGADDGTFYLDPSVLAGWAFDFYGSLYTDLYYSSNGLITFGSGNSAYENANLSSSPPQAAIAPFWDDMVVYNDNAPAAVYYQVQGSDLIIQWNNVSFYSAFNDYSGTPLKFQAILDGSDGTIEFNYANLAMGDSRDNGASATVGVKNVSPADPLLVSFNAGPNNFVGSGKSTVLSTSVVFPSDYYSVSLDAGQSATFGLASDASGFDLELYDEAGTLLTVASAAKTDLDLVISNFVAPSSGEYYLKVLGAAQTDYNLIVTRGANFSLHGGDFDKAQPLGPSGVVLGGVRKPSAPFYVLDDRLYEAFNPIWSTDPNTGEFLPPSIPAPGDPQNNPFGLNLAYDGTFLYYNSGPFFGSGLLYKLDPSDGTIIAQASPTNAINYGDIAYLDGWLYGIDMFNGTLDRIDPDSLTVVSSISSVSGLTGLAGDPDRGVLYGVGQTGVEPILYKIDPATGAVLSQGVGINDGRYEQDMAYVNGQIIISDAGDLGAGNDVLSYYDPETFAFIKALPIATEGFVSGLGGDGLGGSSGDWFRFSVSAGDNLVLETTTPGGTSANGLQFINDLIPTLELYDEAGNLLATDTGGASDGRNAVINFTALTSGQYRVRILGADESVGEYTLAVQGATGAPDPFVVTDTDPAAGSVLLVSPSIITVDFNSGVLGSSLDPSDLTIDGVPATGVELVDGDTVAFTILAVLNGEHLVEIDGITSVSGQELTPYSYTFEVDTVPPYVVSGTIVDGEIFSPAPYDLTEVITFSEPMDTTFTTTTDIVLYGALRDIFYNPTTFVWSADGTELTLTYDNLRSDNYILYLFADGFRDVAGNLLEEDYFVTFSVAAGTSDVESLNPVDPAGSLVYDASIRNYLISDEDVNTYNLTLDPRQTIGLVVTPDPGQVVSVSLITPGEVVITLVSEPGEPVVIPAVQAPDGGTFQVLISGDPGGYVFRPVLNAFVDPAQFGEAPNSSIDTAVSVDPFFNDFIGPLDRTAVLGGLLAPPTNIYVLDDTIYYGSNPIWLTDVNTGVFLPPSISAPGSPENNPFGMNLAYDGTYLYYNMGAFFGDGQLYKINPATGAVVDSTEAPDGWNYGGLAYLNGYVIASAIDNPTLYYFDASTLDFVGSLVSGMFAGAVGLAGDPDRDVIWAVDQFDGGIIYELDPTTGAVIKSGPTSSSGYEQGLAYAYGQLIVSDSLFYGPGGGQLGLYDAETLSFLGSVPVDTQGLIAGLGGDGIYPTSGDPIEDKATYSFTLEEGQSASLVLESLNGKEGQITLYDADGNVLAIGAPGAKNYDFGINNFVARTSGTYYVQVSGSAGLKFNLVLTRGADFDTEDNDTLETAQEFNGNQGILGAITKGTPPFYVLDDQLYGAFNPIWSADPETGVLIPPSIPAPGSPLNNPFGLNLAYDGTYLYYNSGPFDGSGLLYKLDPSTGTVIAQASPANGFNYGDIAFLGGWLYGIDMFSGVLDQIDPISLEVVGSVQSVSGLTGMAGDPERGVLYGVGQTGAAPNLYKIDPQTGAILSQGLGINDGRYEQDMAYVNGQIIISEAGDFGAGNDELAFYDPENFAFIKSVPIAMEGFIAGLGGDGLGSATDDTDYYSFNASAGDTLTITTSTPAGGPDLFKNNLFPSLYLYDPAGNLVAVADGNLDGRNSIIEYVVPAGAGGKWTVQVAQSTATPEPTTGEYGLLVEGASGPLAPFAVTDTIPDDGAVVQPPLTYTVDFSNPVFGLSLTPGQLTVNGIPAIGVVLDDEDTVTWTLDPAYITPGPHELVNVLISADPETGQRVEDLAGTELEDFSATFYIDTVAPEIIDSSISDGDVFSPSPYDVTEVLTFSEPMQPFGIVVLYGQYTDSFYNPDSYEWSADGTQLTISYDALPNDIFILFAFGSSFFDIAGNAMEDNFAVTFAVSFGAGDFATPFTPVEPLGSLIYEGTDGHNLVSPTDVNNLSLPLNAGGTLTLFASPSDPIQLLSLIVLDPSGVTLATATASAPGEPVLLQTIALPTTGDYTIVVSDASGAVGPYTIDAFLNTFLTPGGTNTTIGTAADLTDSSYLLGPGNADRLAALGGIGEPGSTNTDYYSFALSRHQPVTVVVTSLNDLPVAIELLDAGGNVVATGIGGATNVTQAIEKFVAETDGIYYVKVIGEPGAEFSLAITRGATFTLQDHNTLETAQDLTGTNGVLGHIARSSPPLFVLDDQLYVEANPIWAADPETGALIPPAIMAPGDPLNNPFGLNLAYDGTYLYYNSGPFFGTGQLFKLDPSDGTIIAQAGPANAINYGDIAYLGGWLYGIDMFSGVLDQIDPISLEVVGSVQSVSGLVGLAGDPDRGVLYGVGQTGAAPNLYKIDPATGAILSQGLGINDGRYEQDMAYVNGQIVISEAGDFGAGNDELAFYDPDTFAFIKSVPIAMLGFVAGLGGDGLGGKAPDDWYSVNLAAGTDLSLQTSTPSDQGGQFLNTLSVQIELYDASGNLLAVGTPTADGRNQKIDYDDALAGEYFVRVIGQEGSSGEYFLSVDTFETYDISGTVYNDINGGGWRNPGEPGLGGWTVERISSSGVVVDSVVTDAGGNYLFTDVGPGTWTISQVVMPDWVQTQPFFPLDYTVTGTSGVDVGGLVFGNHASAAIDPYAVVDDGDGGYSETGTWSSAVGGLEGGNRVARTIQRAPALSTATWNFTGLEPGVYDVWVTYVGKGGYSSRAPYSVSSDGDALGTVLVNQSVPVTANTTLMQGSFDGVGWVRIMAGVAADGSISVQLTNLSPNNYVDADGVLLVREERVAESVRSFGSLARNATSGAVNVPGDIAIGVISPSGKSSNGNTPTATPTPISLRGVTSPSVLSVAYRANQPLVSQNSALAVDRLLGLGLGSKAKADDNELIASLALDLLTSSKKKA